MPALLGYPHRLRPGAAVVLPRAPDVLVPLARGQGRERYLDDRA